MRKGNARQDRNVRRQIVVLAQGVKIPGHHCLPHLAGPLPPLLRARHAAAALGLGFRVSGLGHATAALDLEFKP